MQKQKHTEAHLLVTIPRKITPILMATVTKLLQQLNRLFKTSLFGKYQHCQWLISTKMEYLTG